MRIIYKINSAIKKYYIAFIAIAVYAVLSNVLFGYFCPSMALVGVPCPACGLTRAGLSLLMLDFNGAFLYNPCIFLVAPLVIFYFILRIYGKGRVMLLFYPAVMVFIISFVVFGYRLIHQFGTEPLIFNQRSLLRIILSFNFLT
ncbi:MAG: DUF2752 domain-containing protein [Clostridiales bacterium]|jgi:hypothetical protein|nr:DUF2752 domain-containing protein [Clostridiales bacterium]